MESAALIEAKAAGAEPFPVLQVAWESRGLDLGAGIYASVERATAAGQVTGLVAEGGWEPIEYGSGVEGGGLVAVETAVSVLDTDGELIRMLQTYDPRGSVASMDWAAPGLVEADWEPLFRGVVENWEQNGLITRILLKTDDAVLRTPVPPALFNRTDWGAAEDSTIFGTHMPLVMGIHDAYLVTARGMIPAVNLRYDKDTGYLWLASVGNLVDIRRIHYDGEPWTGGGWSVKHGVWGQNQLTMIEINEGFQPDKGVVVAFDCEGPDPTGDWTGSSLTNPVTQLRVILEEYIYRPAPLGLWQGDHSIIDDASWDAAAAFVTNFGYECARRWGGDQNEESAAEVIDSFLDAFPWTRIDWTPLGTLAFTIMDPNDVDPTDSRWLDLQAFGEGTPTPPLVPGDRREVYSQIASPYMFSAQEQKYMTAYEAHDVAALARKVLLPIENPWTQGRFIQV